MYTSIYPIIQLSIAITKPEDLGMITSELESKNLKTLSNTDQLNYDRMKWKNSPSYNLSFRFSDTNTENNWFEKGDGTYLVITSNRNVAIEKHFFNDGFFGFRGYREVYPLSLSDETMDMIFSYLNNPAEKQN